MILFAIPQGTFSYDNYAASNAFVINLFIESCVVSYTWEKNLLIKLEESPGT